MAWSTELATNLLLGGLLIGSVLVLQVVAVRHLPVETIPTVLRVRVEFCNRVRPWLIVAAFSLVAGGLVVLVG